MRSFRRLRRHLGKVLMAYWTSGADLLTDDESVDHLRAKTLETVASALRLDLLDRPIEPLDGAVGMPGRKVIEYLIPLVRQRLHDTAL